MTLADRTCDACGGFVSWRDAKVIENRCLCPKCRTAPPKEIPMAYHCTEPGCERPRYKKVSDKENLCYRHLKAKHPELLPPSMRPRTAAPPRKPAHRAVPRPPLKPATRRADGAPHCDTCGQRIPDQVLKAADVLKAHGIKDRTVAIKASALILQAAGQPPGA